MVSMAELASMAPTSGGQVSTIPMKCTALSISLTHFRSITGFPNLRPHTFNGHSATLSDGYVLWDGNVLCRLSRTLEHSRCLLSLRFATRAT